MNRPGSNPPSSTRINATTREQARGFLSSLFLGLRTAQIHEPSNRAFENATTLVFQSASALFTSTGGFSLQLVEDAAFLNGQRLQFDGGAPQSLRTLRSLLESAGLGGIEMRNPPSESATRKLILLFSSSAPQRTAKEEAEQAKVEVLDPGGRVDPRTRAVRCYAKLLLALRDRLPDGASEERPPRLRATRIVQELVEIGADRTDHLLRLATSGGGGNPAERLGASTAVLALVLGQALGLRREVLVDLGLAALLHHVGGGEDLGVAGVDAAVARLARQSTVGPAANLRACIVGERAAPMPRSAGGQEQRKAPHPLSRIVSVAASYQQLVSGFGTGEAGMSPPEAVTRLLRDEEERYDRRIVDLLVNVLRIFPPGTEVILESGEHAVVTELGARWDHPVVRVEAEEEPRTIDLAGGDFRIAGTQRFLGKGDRQTLDEVEFPPIFTAEQLSDIGVEGDVVRVDVSLEEESEASDRRPVVPLAEAMGEFETGDKEPVTELSPIPEIEANDVEFIDTEEGQDLYEIVEPLDEEDEENLPKTMLEGASVMQTSPQPEEILVSEPPAISEIDELKQRLERRKKRESEREKARRKSRIQHLEAQLQAYRAEREELEEEIEALREDATSAKRLTESVEDRRREVEKTIAEAQERMSDLEQLLDDLWARRQELGQEANDLEHRAATARSDAGDALAKAEQAAQEAAARAERIAALKAELEKLEEEERELSQTADTFDNAANEAKRLAKEAEGKAEALREEAQATIPELTSKEEELDRLRARQSGLDEEQTALAESTKHAASLAEEAEERLADAETRIAETQRVIAELEAELEQMS